MPVWSHQMSKIEPIVLEPSSTDVGRFSVMDIFELQLDSSIVTLLACASGKQDVAPNHDPLGIVSQHSCTPELPPSSRRCGQHRPPTLECSATGSINKHSRTEEGLLLASTPPKAFQLAVQDLWEDWDQDEPYHWAQFLWELPRLSLYMVKGGRM
ncbi:MAG: hypothetical protein M1816_001346 [Peltula sp. TS41687]|nr:MAG: hypothetical protein M1816_001346 [Peltula sp. TS41687]